MTTDHDHDVRKLYRESAADEPPAALDHAILKAARESVAPARKPKPWWLRFALPLQLAFSAVLVAMLALMVDRSPPDGSSVTDRPEPQQAPASGSVKESPPMADSPEGGSPVAPQANEAKARPAAPMELAAPSPRADRKAEAAPAALPAPGRSERASAEKAVAADATAPVGAPPLEAAKSGTASTGAMPSAGVSPLAGAPAANRMAVARNPSDWLAAIERLAATGEKSAARTELESFHKAYPEYPVPSALEKLLAP